jgi:hypothetical protein
MPGGVAAGEVLGDSGEWDAEDGSVGRRWLKSSPVRGLIFMIA